MYGLMAALMVTTVAYAVLQTTLNISGTVTKKGGSWDIHFANLSTPTLTGDASVENADLEGTVFDFDATVVKPGDSIVYTFDVVNGGTIDATLDSVTLTGATEAKAHDITYTLTYADGKAITKGDALKSEQTRTLKLTVSYDDVESLAEEDITLDLGATLIYVQTSEQSEEESGGVDTPMLTSVTLTDLYNAGKMEIDNSTAFNSMTLFGPMESGSIDVNVFDAATITFNGYASITAQFHEAHAYMKATFVDGSIHEIKYEKNVTIMVPVASGSETTVEEQTFAGGVFYYIDGVAQRLVSDWSENTDEYNGTIPFTIEGEIATLYATTSVADINFTEILIEE